MSSYNWKDKIILVAEDNDLNSKLLQKIMEPAGIQMIFVTDGKPAIEAFIRNPDIDVVLMDIHMPEMDGYEAIRAIRTISPDIPIIAQTAYAMEDEKENIIEAGCNEYLSKPISPKELFRVLSKYLNG